MEVHADINTNPNLKSNDALKEAMGYIMEWVLPSGKAGGPYKFELLRIKWCNQSYDSGRSGKIFGLVFNVLLPA